MSVYWDFKDAVCEGIYTNVATLSAHSQTENMWLNAGQKLNENWQTETDPALEAVINEILVKNPDGTTINVQASEANMQDFILGDNSTFGIPDPAHPGQYISWFSEIGSWAQHTTMQLLGILSQCWDTGTGSKSSLQQNTIAQQGSAITAQMGLETTTSDSEGKTYGSMVTNDASAGQPFSNAGDDFSGVLSGFASLLTTIAA